MTTHRLWISLLSLCLLSLLAVGCAQPTPEERVAELRAGYTADLNGFVVVQQPVPMEPMLDDDGNPVLDENGEPVMVDPTAVTEEAEGDQASDAAPAAVPVAQDIKLDIMVNNDNYEKLPGLTLDVSQADSNEVEKNHWKIYIDTSEIARGNRSALVHTLEGVDFQEGDGFAVEVRSPVPAEERSEYREFSEAS
ncbi:MAG: hypothetical protein AAF481_10845 [Acidobacteriota bacterium]